VRHKDSEGGPAGELGCAFCGRTVCDEDKFTRWRAVREEVRHMITLRQEGLVGQERSPDGVAYLDGV
jgi:hypothetical protein